MWDVKDKFDDIQSFWLLFFNRRILWVTHLQKIISLSICFYREASDVSSEVISDDFLLYQECGDIFSSLEAAREGVL